MSKLKILIVDDSQLNREILSCMLEDKYDICEAENGKQAVEILERCHKDFKLVLLDLIMTSTHTLFYLSFWCILP